LKKGVNFHVQPVNLGVRVGGPIKNLLHCGMPTSWFVEFAFELNSD
jgi:hypothetical protein